MGALDGELAFLRGGELVVGAVGGEKVYDGVAQELEALVVLALRLAHPARGRGESSLEKPRLGKGVAEN